MAETYTVTKAKYAGDKDNPHGGKLHKFYCSFVDPATNQEFHDVYWQRKDENQPEGEFYGRIEKGEFGLRFYTEQKQNGGSPRSGGSSGAKDQKDDAWWYAKDRRISRAGILQAVVASGVAQNATGDTDEYVAAVNLLTDALLASLDAHAPHPSSDADASGGSQPRSRQALAGAEELPVAASVDPAGVSAPTGFASDKQKNFFERLLKQANLDSNQVAAVVRFTEQLPTERVSKAIDGLNDNDSELAERTVAALLRESDAWARLQSDVPFDEDA